MTTPPDSTPAATPTYIARGVHVCTGDGLFATATDTRDALLIARALNERPALVTACSVARDVMEWLASLPDDGYISSGLLDDAKAAHAQCVLALGEVAL